MKIRKNSRQIVPFLLVLERYSVFVFLFSLMIPLSVQIGQPWSRIYFWDLSLFAMFALWTVRMSINYEQAIKFSFLDAILITLILWFFVCNFFGPRPIKSFEVWFLWVRAYLIYMYFSRNMGRVISVRSFLIMLLILVFIEGSLSIFQQATKSNFGQMNQYFGTPIKKYWFKNVKYIRSNGTFIKTNILAGWMLILLPILVVWRFYETNRLLKKIVDGVWILGILSAISTLSRSKLVTMTISLIIIFYWHRYHFSVETCRKNPRAFFLTIANVSVILISAVVIFSGIIGGIWQRFNNMEENFERKFTQMIIAVEIMKESPVFGVGQGNYGYKVDKERYPYRHKGEVTCHNIPLKIGAESGVIGFITFISFCLYVFVKWFQVIKTKPSSFSQALLGGALTSVICVFFDMQWNITMTHHSFLPLFFVVLGFAFSTEISTAPMKSTMYM